MRVIYQIIKKIKTKHYLMLIKDISLFIRIILADSEWFNVNYNYA